jgi:hypothetical protein
MPKTPKGHKRPADVIPNAVHVMKIATGEIEEPEITEDGKNRAAVMLGSKGGKARAKKLGVRRRKSSSARVLLTRDRAVYDDAPPSRIVSGVRMRDNVPRPHARQSPSWA